MGPTPSFFSQLATSTFPFGNSGIEKSESDEGGSTGVDILIYLIDGVQFPEFPNLSRTIYRSGVSVNSDW